MTEGLLLSLLGVVAGAVMTRWMCDGLISIMATAVTASGIDVRPDARVLWFGASLAVGVTLLLGLVPAWQAARTEVQQSLRSSSQAVVGAGSRRLLSRVLLIWGTSAVPCATGGRSAVDRDRPKRMGDAQGLRGRAPAVGAVELCWAHRNGSPRRSRAKRRDSGAGQGAAWRAQCEFVKCGTAVWAARDVGRQHRSRLPSQVPCRSTRSCQNTLPLSVWNWPAAGSSPGPITATLPR